MWADLKAGKAYGRCLSFFRGTVSAYLWDKRRESGPKRAFFVPFRGDTGLMTAIPVPIPATTGLRTGIFLCLPDVSESFFWQEKQGGRPSGKVCRRKKKKIRHALTAFLDKRGATGSGLGSFNSCFGLFNNCVSPRSLVSSGSRWVSTQPWRRSGLWARDTSRGARRRPAIVPARGATWCRSRRG